VARSDGPANLSARPDNRVDDEKEMDMDDDQQATASEAPRSTLARWGRPGAFAAAGEIAGGLLAGSLSASAADDPRTATEGSGSTATAPPWASNSDSSQPQRSDEELLAGSTADKVEAAALARYPGATVVRIETDSDGVYEAHLTTADGQPVTVEVDTSFAVTGIEQGRPGGPGGHDGQCQPSAESGTDASGYGT
jgi:uncharacterized membrane protein YkoI